MDLLLVVGKFPQRSETFIVRKAISLARRGHRVTVAARSEGDWALIDTPLPGSLAVEVWPPDSGLRDPRRALAAAAGAGRWTLRAGTRVRSLVEMIRADPRTREQAHVALLRHLPLVGRTFDVVHFEFVSIAPMYPFAAALTGAPLVVSCRGTEAHTLRQRSPSEQAPLLDVLRRADAVHCVSTEIAEIVRQATGRDAGIFVNRPAVDVAAIAARVPTSASDGVLRLVTTGRLVWQKGLDYLLAAVASLVKREVSVHLEILGDGELRNALAFSIGDLGLEQHVTLEGAVSAATVLDRMRAADVFVLASHTEGISNAVLEAMAVGLPVVTTNAGGMSEAVTDGVEGFVVPVRNSDALADRIAELARNPERRRTMGAAGRERVEREFSIERQADTFEAVYGSLRP